MSDEDGKHRLRHQSVQGDSGNPVVQPLGSPGKRTLTMSLPPRSPNARASEQAPVQQKADPAAVTQRKERTALTERWMDVAMRPDLYQAPVQRKSTGKERNDDSGLLRASTHGQPLPAAVQAKMESAFDADFTKVRIHVGPQAPAMGALAYTQGTDIHFAPGHYNPGSQRGQELLGHELTHVVQQSQGRVQGTTQAKGVAVNADPGLEREADEMGARAAQDSSEPAHQQRGAEPMTTGSHLQDAPVQRKNESGSANSPAANESAVSPASSAGSSSIDPPQSGINKPGFIDNDDGSNIRTRPAELHGAKLTDQPLPAATRVFVSGLHPETSQWWYVSAFLPSGIIRGYVQHFRVNTDLPELSAKLYQIKSGDTVEKLAVQEFSAHVRDGHDLRYYENVLLAVNRDKNRAGIKGTFQDPNVLGGGANNIQLEAGRRIWLVSPGYARSLEGVVPDGSLTNGLYAKAKRVLGHIEDLVQSVTDSPRYFGTVAGQYAKAIKDHLPEIIGITAGFIIAESASAFLAATPTGVGQLAAVVIQLGLAAFGAKFAVDAGVEALKHGERWLTLAWTAHGDPKQLAEASKAFLQMLVSIAMAALAIAGVRGNVGKGLKVADAIKIQPPTIGMSPAMAGADGGLMGGGIVFTPGSITSAGSVDIGISAMSATGGGGSKGATEMGDTTSLGKEGESRQLNQHGGGKNAKHANMKAREVAEKRWQAAKEKLAEAKKNGAPKKEKQRLQREIDHWKRKMDFTGESHSQAAKR